MTNLNIEVYINENCNLHKISLNFIRQTIEKFSIIMLCQNRGGHMGEDRIIGDEKKQILEYIDIANQYSKADDYEKSFEILEKALYKAESLEEHSLKAKVHNNIGNTRAYIGDYEKALEQYMIALHLFEEINEVKGISGALLNIGVLYLNQNYFNESLEYFNNSLELYKVINDKQGICFATNNIGIIYLELEEHEKARHMFEESGKMARTLGDRGQIATYFTNLGTVETKLNNFNKALEYYEQALEIENQLQCKRTLSNVLYSIAEVYFFVLDYKNMLYFLEKSLKDAKEAKDKLLELDCYKLYYTYFEKEENYKEALKYHKLYSSLNEIIFNEKRNEITAELKIKYDIYKKEKEKEIYKLKNIELMELNEKLGVAYKELEVLHNTDYLTKIYNRKAITEIMEKELYHNKNISPFIICIADIDDFKKVNDTYGHEAGDEVLCSCSNILTEYLRKSDYVARWGGEEFLIILPSTNLNDGNMVIEKLRKTIARGEVVYHDQVIKVTMTFGVACFYGEHQLKECIELADKYLYKGKSNGKNCLCSN